MIATVEPQIEVVRRKWLTAAQNHDVDQKLNHDLGAGLLLEEIIRAKLQISDTQFATIYQAIIYSRFPYSISLSWARKSETSSTNLNVKPFRSSLDHSTRRPVASKLGRRMSPTFLTPRA